MTREPDKVSDWVPVVLRLPWHTPPSLLIAAFAMMAAQYGWLAKPLGLTRPAEVTLGIALVAVTLWLTEAVPLFVTSLIVLGLELVLLEPVLRSGGHDATLFLNAFFSDVTLLFLGGFVLSAAIERTGLDRRFARAILRRAGNSPQRVLFAMMVTTSLIGTWMSNTAACALMLGPVSSLLARAPAGDGFRKAILLGIAFSANLGGLPTPISSPPNAVVMRYLGDKAPSFGLWMLLAVPLLLVLQSFLVLYLGRRFPSAVAIIALADEPVRPLGRAQWLVLGVFAVTVLGWIVGSYFSLSSGTVALFPVVVFFGTNLLRASELRALPWEVILLIGGGLALGAAVDESGLAAWAGAHIPAGELPEFVLQGVVAVLAVAISSVMSNTAAVNLLAPVVMGLDGVAHAPLLVIMAFACTLSMPLPVSTPPNAMAYGFSVQRDGKGEFTARDMIGPGSITTLVGLIVLALCATYWFPAVWDAG